MAKDPDPSWGSLHRRLLDHRQPIVRPPARRAAPPVVTATTSRHKKLLGESLPQPPPVEPKGKAAAPLSPIPSPNEDDIDDDGPVDVDAYLNTGADIDDLYMAGADEEAYRARDEPAGPPKATKQRLVFRGFSQETPPAADTQEPTAANIFSPNTLINKVNEKFEASGAVAPKKPRKRPSKNKEKSASQPPPTIRHRDSMVPPSKDGLTRMHEAGKPILGPELQHTSGDMLPLRDNQEREYPDVAIADPYYMRESQLNLSAVRVRASLYLQKCFLDNKRKDNILLAYFPEDTHCVLISIAPKFSLATYFDSGSAKKKNYARIRGVLDDALEGYFKKGGAFKEKAECFRDDGKHKFKHVFEFPCVKQPENSTLDAFYVMHHLKGFVRDSQNLRLPSALRGWAEKLARINDDDLRKTSRIPGSKMPTYVVYKGRVPGVYEEWQDCLEQVHKFSGNSYKGYATREEAVAQWRAHVGKKKNRLKFLVPLLLTATAVVLYFTLV
ncbi:hypothetical protein QYE76_062123 [Lolium multiflorum]|uniref:Ribonuclease H1 N-terminal domain-containing protein n=1 Tax=Lolium multiflorum TaxID=4521 RepID=A0AAD8S3F5_LOLMU|nr:hypothetical protein QYE76_062123 [Lolium multiflorum]